MAAPGGRDKLEDCRLAINNQGEILFSASPESFAHAAHPMCHWQEGKPCL
jgi:hypothetical protein